MAEVILKEVSKSFDELTVVHQLDLHVPDGSFTVLVGPSGCGKSTTLRLIAGLESVSSGEIWLNNKKINDVAPGKRDIAMVFQNYALYPTMTVKENIEFGLKNRGVPSNIRKKRIAEIIDLVDLGDYLHRKPSTLSGGQRQRVALARAIIKKPQVFLMDEPLSNLDAKLRHQVRMELIELHRQLGTTFIYVTHDQVEAMSMGDQIVLMNQGAIQQVDEPTALYQNPHNQFTAQFIGTPSMNIFTPPQPKNLHIGIRPEKLILTRSNGTTFSFYPFEPTAKKQSLPGLVTGREILGAETLYQVKTDWGMMVAKTHTEVDAFIQPNEEITIQLPIHDLYYFDAQTGERMAPPANFPSMDPPVPVPIQAGG